MKRTFYVCSTACAADYQQEKRVLISCETCGGLFFVRNKTTIAAVWCCWVMFFLVFFSFKSNQHNTIDSAQKNKQHFFTHHLSREAQKCNHNNRKQVSYVAV